MEQFFKKGGQDELAVSNTSVLLLKNSSLLYAIDEGSAPFAIEKKDLRAVGFNRFNWLKTAFSAHPKIDPKTG